MTATIYSEGCTVEVIVNPPPATGDPAWLAGKPLNTWIQIPNTKMADMSGPEMGKIVAAGLCGLAPNYATQFFPDGTRTGGARGGIMGFSGGCLKTSGSEMLLFGSGGAGGLGDWIGNDVRGLRLEDDAPQWRLRTTPQNFDECYARSNPPGTTPYEKPWATNPEQYCKPRSGHMYAHMFFDDATNSFWRTRCDFVGNWDAGRFAVMDSISFDTDKWSQGALAVDWIWDGTTGRGTGAVKTPGTHPGSPLSMPVSGFTCKSPAGIVYQNGNAALYRFDPAAVDSATYPGYTVTGKWSTMTGASVPTPPSHGAGAFHIAQNAIVYVNSVPRKAGGTVVPLKLLTVRLNRAGDAMTSATAATLTDGNVSASELGWTEAAINFNAPGLVYDAELDKLIYFQDDGKLYTLTWLSDSSYRVDLLVGSLGSFPPIAGSGPNNGGHQIGLWSRIQYVPNLKGVCIVQHGTRDAYFVRTVAP